MTPLVVVSGKGGVGKSALSAAVSLAAHRQGRRVLSVAMTGDGGGLTAHLGGPPLRFEPTEIKPGLSAMVVDRSKALVEYLQIQLGIPGFAAFGPAARAFDALASTAPGIREIVTMGKVVYEVKQGRHDLVVADAPPTGQIASHLRAMRTISELVPTGKIREQAVWMEEIIAHQTRLILAVIPEELPVSETEETLAQLEADPTVGEISVVANRVLPRLVTDRHNLPAGNAGAAARLHLHLYDEQQRWLSRLGPTRRLPYLFGVMTPAEVAARLSETWEEEP